MDVEQAVIVVEKLLKNSSSDQNLSDIQELVLRQCWLGLSYQKIADRSGYETDYIKHIGAKLWKTISQATNKKVTKRNICSLLRQYWQEQKTELKTSLVESSTEPIKSTQDWGNAIDVATFFGRESEINQCKNWIVQERCRLLTILGMGGVGKTAIASKLAREIAGEFQYVIWRSLRNAPPFVELLSDLILFVSGHEVISLPDSIDVRITILMQYLSTSRCLLILDNGESILRSGETGGLYRQGYEGYGQLFRRLADESHQSCLIITSREQARGIANRVGFDRVRSLQLSGLSLTAAKKILKVKGVADSQQLIKQYAGNPLALKIAATKIKSLFAGNIGEFLVEGTIVFGDIWDLLEQQFNRLSQLEQAVMFWLAINREAINLSQLKQDVFPVISARKLLETLESLQRRSLIEVNISGFTQQPIVMEYMTEKIIDIFETEISNFERTYSNCSFSRF